MLEVLKLLEVLKMVRKAQHIGDEDVKAFLNNVQQKNKRSGAVRTT